MGQCLATKVRLSLWCFGAIGPTFDWLDFASKRKAIDLVFW